MDTIETPHGRTRPDPRVQTALGHGTPLFFVTGKFNHFVPWQDAERLAAEASGPGEKPILEDGNHVASHRACKYRPRSADWMARQLGLPSV